MSGIWHELEYWLSSEFAGGQLDIGDQEESLTAGHSYLNDFSRKINQINI
ncbi:hypothetical protein [Lactobacillus helveticus]|nr:hypothetical protein [Lactobacillus helveticus]